MNITFSSVQELKLTNITWAITDLTIDTELRLDVSSNLTWSTKLERRLWKF